METFEAPARWSWTSPSGSSTHLQAELSTLCASSALCPALDADQCRSGFCLALVHGELNAELLQDVRRSEESEVSVPGPPPSEGHFESNVALSKDHSLRFEGDRLSS